MCCYSVSIIHSGIIQSILSWHFHYCNKLWYIFPRVGKGTAWMLMWRIAKWESSSGDRWTGSSVFHQQRLLSHSSWFFLTEQSSCLRLQAWTKRWILYVRRVNPPEEICWQLNEYSWRTQTNEHSICKYVQSSLPSDDLAKFQGQLQGKRTFETRVLQPRFKNNLKP